MGRIALVIVAVTFLIGSCGKKDEAKPGSPKEPAYWFSSRLWGVVGISAGGLFRRPTTEIPASESGGFGLHALVGFELLRTKSRKGALNLQLRVFGGVPDEDDDVGGLVLLLGGAGFGLE